MTHTIRTLAQHARRAYPTRDYTDPQAVRHLRRGYIRSRIILGSRWILAEKVVRKVHEKRDAVVVAVAVIGTTPFIVSDILARLA